VSSTLLLFGFPAPLAGDGASSPSSTVIASSVRAPARRVAGPVASCSLAAGVRSRTAGDEFLHGLFGRPDAVGLEKSCQEDDLLRIVSGKASSFLRPKRGSHSSSDCSHFVRGECGVEKLT